MTLSFQQFGGAADMQGPIITGVIVQELVPQALYTVVDIIDKVTVGTNNMPGNRIFFYALTSFMTSFDRLQLYYFHRQNISEYSNILLSTVNTISDDRGQLPQKILRNC